jgi:hypothetical protein
MKKNPLVVHPPTVPDGAEHTLQQRKSNPVIPSAAWVRDIRQREEAYLLRKDRSFRRRMFLREVEFWLLVFGAAVALAAAILMQ